MSWSDDLSNLETILTHWEEDYVEAAEANAWSFGAALDEERRKGSRHIAKMLAESARPRLPLLLEDNSNRTAEELAEIAADLSPGGAHDGAFFIRMVRARIWNADPLLVAAAVWYNWHGGKAGFQFLPDPASVDLAAYQDEAIELIGFFDEALCGDLTRILTKDDRAFFEQLPESFTVYRGCSGISKEQAESGVCWTTDSNEAERFARRWANDEAHPILLSAHITKSDVRLAKASECEVVVLPVKARCRKVRTARG